MIELPGALAHDYLAQYGGAERVVAEWVNMLPTTPIYALAYDPTSTYVEFGHADVRTPAIGRSRAFSTRIPAYLPVLPLLATRTYVESDSWVLTSSSGFAHGFRSLAPTVVYCHSPARWVYESNDYRRGLAPAKRVALKALTPYLRVADQRAASRAAAYIANSKVTQARIARAYGILAPVVNPPVGSRPAGVKPDVKLPSDFALCVARSRGYKNVALAIESARSAGLPIVIVGSGSHLLNERGVIGLGRVSDGELSWLYARARLLIAVAQEDFGLTPVEAAQFGTPTVAIDAGGYRESVSDGESGILVGNSVGEIAAAVRIALRTDWNKDQIQGHAEKFAPLKHLNAILEVAESVV